MFEKDEDFKKWVEKTGIADWVEQQTEERTMRYIDELVSNGYSHEEAFEMWKSALAARRSNKVAIGS